MKRLAALILAVLAFGAACSSSSSSPAATVNGAAISTRELVDELNAIGGNANYLNGLQSAFSQGGASVTGATPGSYDAAFVSQVLLEEINYAMVHQEFAKRKLAVSDACRLRAKNEAKLQIGNGDADKGGQLLDQFTKDYQDTLVRRNVELLALETNLAQEDCGNEANTYYASHPGDFTKFCVSLIAVADQATADSVVAQARGGADFGALVQQFSTDASTKANNGDAGCILAGQLNPSVRGALQSAKVGDVVDPIPGQSGVSILKLTNLETAAIDEPGVSEQANELATNAADAAFSQWLQQARAQAKVTVDARYGTFDPSGFRINPPTLDLNSNSPSPDTSSSSSEG